MYAAVLTLIASLASVGYQSPVDQQLANRSSSSAIETVQPSVDQLMAADLAASTAQFANLSVASNVSNLSISLNAKSELAQTNDDILSKPQIIQVTETRGVTSYTAASGDTIPSVATKFGVSADTVRWANGLASDALAAGQQLSVPKTDGVLYTAKDGDTIDALASKYQADKSRIISYNDLELSGLQPGQRIVLPGGVLPVNERPKAASASGSTTGLRASAASVGNKYDYGYCTWYAYNRRAQLGRPVGSFWGNATTWASYARASGYVVDHNPEVGAVLQDGYSAGGFGHVAVVERVNSDGSVTVSEMNYSGWAVQDMRTISAGQASGYNYIH